MTEKELKKLIKELKNKPSEVIIVDSVKIFYDNIK